MRTIESGLFGAFYRDGDNWRGPINGDLFTIEEVGGTSNVEQFLKEYAQLRKKKVKLFRQVWEAVDIDELY